MHQAFGQRAMYDVRYKRNSLLGSRLIVRQTTVTSSLVLIIHAKKKYILAKIVAESLWDSNGHNRVDLTKSQFKQDNKQSRKSICAEAIAKAQ